METSQKKKKSRKIPVLKVALPPSYLSVNAVRGPLGP